jgi:hypothetical protein
LQILAASPVVKTVFIPPLSLAVVVSRRRRDLVKRVTPGTTRMAGTR